MTIITLTTDFGTGSPYVAAMKGVILSINPAATLVDITHSVRPQDVRHAALVLDDVAPRFPPEDAIHVAVVDPGVGTDRAILYAEIDGHRYVAPDNGLLSRLARRTPPARLRRLTEPQYWLEPVSATFHGRDVMAPVAGHLSRGLDPAKLGPAVESLVMLDWPEPVATPGQIAGQVLDVDSFGNVVTNVSAVMLAKVPAGRRIRIQCAGREIDGVSTTYGDRRPGALIALVGSTGRLELAIVGASAARSLDAQVGEPVTVTWH